MNNYQIINTIGEGAYGLVLKARRIDTNTFVAIKKFKETDDDDLIKKTTLRQLKVLKSLRHKNIVELREAFKKRGLVHLIFQYVDNNLLEVLQSSHQGLSVRSVAKFMYQLLQGLEYMHSNNYIHRDIKPENLLINKNQGILKICDMGFARLFDDQMTDYVATRWYRPPQLLIGMPYTTAIDIWAVGCIMGELIDGQPLFPGLDEIDQLFQIIGGIGEISRQCKAKMNQSPVWKNMKLPTNKSPFCILERYRAKISHKGIQLLQALLEIDPQKRITAGQALKHPFFDFIRPKKIRFQKTSDGWLLKSKEKVSINENYTDRRVRETQCAQITSPQILNKTKQNLIKSSLKHKINPNIPVNLIQKNHVITLKQNMNNIHGYSNSLTTQNNSHLIEINMNKIYRNKENLHSKYLKVPQNRLKDRLLTDSKGQNRSTNNNPSGSYQSIGRKHAYNKTKTEFRLMNKKKEKSSYYGHA